MVTLYFTDYIADDEQILSEVSEINKILCKNGLEELSIKKYTTTPPFKGHSEQRYYDIMFFDYGGAMDISYSIVQNFIECILKEANECPNRYYVVTSTFSLLLSEFKEVVKKDFGNEKPFNVFLSIQDFIQYYNKYEKS